MACVTGLSRDHISCGKQERANRVVKETSPKWFRSIARSSCQDEGAATSGRLNMRSDRSIEFVTFERDVDNCPVLHTHNLPYGIRACDMPKLQPRFDAIVCLRGPWRGHARTHQSLLLLVRSAHRVYVCCVAVRLPLRHFISGICLWACWRGVYRVPRRSDGSRSARCISWRVTWRDVQQTGIDIRKAFALFPPFLVVVCADLSDLPRGPIDHIVIFSSIPGPAIEAAIVRCMSLQVMFDALSERRHRVGCYAKGREVPRCEGISRLGVLRTQ